MIALPHYCTDLLLGFPSSSTHYSIYNLLYFQPKRLGGSARTSCTAGRRRGTVRYTRSVHPHTHTSVHTHIQTHTLTHIILPTHTHQHTHSLIHPHPHQNTHSLIHTLTLFHTHTHTHTHTHYQVYSEVPIKQIAIGEKLGVSRAVGVELSLGEDRDR